MNKTDEWPLTAQEDVVTVRQAVRSYAVAIGISLIDQTKLVTAVSELARNAVVHGGGGRVKLEVIERTDQAGLRLTFEDRGPGIPDIDLALQDGFTTGSGLGLGLGGSKRLVSEFALESQPGKGTKVTITQWKNRR